MKVIGIISGLPGFRSYSQCLRANITKMTATPLPKTICFFLFFLVGAKASAQHCPYDGMYMIVVHVPEQVTQPGGTTLPRLTEVDNNEAGNCHAAKGLLQKTFLPVGNLLHDSLNLLPNKAVVTDFCSDCAFLGAGYYAVKLTQQERYCMLYDSSKNLERRPRKFVMWYGAQKIALPPEQVYRLCWAEGAWSRIQLVEIPGSAPQKRTGLKSSKPNKAYKKLKRI
jgi:hypothetical protein